MRILLTLLIAAAAVPADEPVPVPARGVRSLAVGPARLWIATESGLYALEKYGLKRVFEGRSDVRRAGDAVVARTPRGLEAVDGDVSGPLAAAWAAAAPAPPSIRFRGVRYEIRDGGLFAGRGVVFDPEDGPRRVHALARDAEGRLWCATDEGVRRHDGAAFVRRIGGRDLGVVTALARDRDGALWIGSGSSFRGVYRRDPDGGAWAFVRGIDAYVHRIALDRSGALWFAGLGEGDRGGGAWVRENGAFREAVPGARVYDVVARDRSGALWFATRRGVAVYRGPGDVERFADGLRGERVFTLHAASDDSIWIGYQGTPGASRLSQGAVEHFPQPGAAVWSIVEGPPGVLWFGTERGVARYDGMRWTRFPLDVPVWPLLVEGDVLRIGTLGRGTAMLSLGDTEAPRTTIRTPEVARDGTAVVRWSSTDAWLATPRDELRYRWRVDGGAWSPSSPQPRATVDPGPGTHTFQVQAIDRFGNVESPPAAATVEVPARTLPDWTWPLLLAVVAFSAAVIWYRGRRPRRRT